MTKTDEVLIEVRPGRSRVALLGGGRLIELLVEYDDNPSIVSNIYLGRVEKVAGSLNAAFIDIGLERSGFLALAEARPAAGGGGARVSISDYIREGERVCVQVVRDPFDGKGAKLTTRLALAGRNVVMTPGDPAVRVSRRIGDGERRSRLEDVLRSMAGPDEGFIVRTRALEASDEDIAADIAGLRRDWSDIASRRDGASPPSLLRAGPDGVVRALRDYLIPGVNRVVIDDAAAYRRAGTYLETSAADMAGRLILHNSTTPLLDGGELAADMEQALSPLVPLPSGGTVIFSETPALVAIDVNVAGTARGGREQSALATNLEAALEITRQIRLRNLGGLLVVDFVSMKSGPGGAEVLAALRAAAADDSEQVFIAGWTRFGLVEMTRRRGRPSLGASLGGPCPACGGGYRLSAETLAFMVLDRLAVEAHAEPSMGLELRAGAELVDALGGPARAALRAFEERLGRPLTITLDAGPDERHYEIVRTDMRKMR